MEKETRKESESLVMMTARQVEDKLPRVWWSHWLNLESDFIVRGHMLLRNSSVVIGLSLFDFKISCFKNFLTKLKVILEGKKITLILLPKYDSFQLFTSHSTISIHRILYSVIYIIVYMYIRMFIYIYLSVIT